MPRARIRTASQILAIAVACLVLHLVGIKRDLPHATEPDEPIFVTRAVNIAATGDLNPHWFGNPGSTVIYPLAALYHLRGVLNGSGVPGKANPAIAADFKTGETPFYLIGRIFSVAFAVGSVFLVFALGRVVFSTPAALAAACLFTVCPLAIFQAQIVRTDAAAVFFGLLSLLLCVRAWFRPNAINHAIAGVSIGVAVSTRYFMVSLLPVLLLVDAVQLLRAPAGKRLAMLPAVATGLVAAVAGFLAATPYFLPDFATALADIREEARSTHPGADGFSPPGNLAWYLTRAIPSALTWPQALAAAAGLALVAMRDGFPRRLLAVYSGVFLIAISVSPLHWARWTVQLLPVLSLFAAHALETATSGVAARFGLATLRKRLVWAAAMIALCTWPAGLSILQAIRFSRPSTRIQAREWILDNIPRGSHIACEAYTAPLDAGDYVIESRFSLAERPTPADYRAAGFQYLLASGGIYRRYYAQPDRYPAQISFYESLRTESRLLAEFAPSIIRAGPVVRVYKAAE